MVFPPNNGSSSTPIKEAEMQTILMYRDELTDRKNRYAERLETAATNLIALLPARPSLKQAMPWMITACSVGAAALAIFYRPAPLQMSSEIPHKATIDMLNRIQQGGVKEGVLHEGESVLDILKQDWATVGRLNTTHQDIAAFLKKILVVLPRKEERYEIKDWDIKDITKSTGEKISPQSFLIKYRVLSLGCTGQIIRCPSHYMDITNSNTGEKIWIQPDLIDLIEKYGFYGGGDSRIDPVKLLSVLRGES